MLFDDMFYVSIKYSHFGRVIKVFYSFLLLLLYVVFFFLITGIEVSNNAIKLSLEFNHYVPQIFGAVLLDVYSYNCYKFYKFLTLSFSFFEDAYP
jgi:hypothetical protein